jgi:hypothetical protein
MADLPFSRNLIALCPPIVALRKQESKTKLRSIIRNHAAHAALPAFIAIIRVCREVKHMKHAACPVVVNEQVAASLLEPIVGTSDSLVTEK